jgi:tight adherence protein C
MPLEFIMIGIGMAGLVVFSACAFRSRFGRYQALVRERIGRAPHDGPTPRSADAGRPTAVGTKLAKILPSNEQELEAHQLRLARGGFTSQGAAVAFFVARLAGLVVPIVVGWGAYQGGKTTLGFGMTCGVSAAGVGFIGPTLWLEWCIARRLRSLRRGIPDFLDLMIVCLESGLSVPAAVQRVSDEISLAQPLLGTELAKLQRDMALGIPIDRAFRNLAERSDLEAIRTLSTFIRESNRFGSELVEAFRTQADLLRHEREQLAEEQAQKASVKMLLPMLLLILPAVFVVLAGPAAIQIHEAFSKKNAPARAAP